MKYDSRRKTLTFSVGAFLAKCLSGQITSRDPYSMSQFPEPIGPPSTIERKTSQAIVEDHEKALQELDQIAKLVNRLKASLKQNGPSVLPVPVLRDADEIQKLAKKIRDRIRR